MSILNVFKKSAIEEPVVEGFFKTKEDYLAMRQAWKDYINNGRHKTEGLEAEHHLIYAVLRKRDPKLGFKPVEKQIKLVNGAEPYQGLLHAKRKIWWATQYDTYMGGLMRPFGDTVTREMIHAVGEITEAIKIGCPFHDNVL